MLNILLTVFLVWGVIGAIGLLPLLNFVFEVRNGYKLFLLCILLGPVAWVIGILILLVELVCKLIDKIVISRKITAIKEWFLKE